MPIGVFFVVYSKTKLAILEDMQWKSDQQCNGTNRGCVIFVLQGEASTIRLLDAAFTAGRCGRHPAPALLPPFDWPALTAPSCDCVWFGIFELVACTGIDRLSNLIQAKPSCQTFAINLLEASCYVNSALQRTMTGTKLCSQPRTIQNYTTEVAKKCLRDIFAFSKISLQRFIQFFYQKPLQDTCYVYLCSIDIRPFKLLLTTVCCSVCIVRLVDREVLFIRVTYYCFYQASRQYTANC